MITSQQCAPERCAQDAAVLVPVDGAVSSTCPPESASSAQPRPCCRRRSAARSSGNRSLAISISTAERCSCAGGGRRGLRRPHLAVQHFRPYRLGVIVRQARAQAHLLHLLHARRRHVRARVVRGGLEGCWRSSSALLHHRLHVWRRLRHHPGLPRRHVRHAIRRRHPWPPADGVVDGGHPRARGRQLPARHAHRRGFAPDRIYGPILYILAGLLVVGFIANLLCARQSQVAHERGGSHRGAGQHQIGGRAVANGLIRHRQGRLDGKAALFWLLVGVPLAWGVWNTVQKTLVLLQ